MLPKDDIPVTPKEEEQMDEILAHQQTTAAQVDQSGPYEEFEDADGNMWAVAPQAAQPVQDEREALIAAHNAMDALLAWDAGRNFLVPYKVRDPIYAALGLARVALAKAQASGQAVVNQSLTTAPTSSPSLMDIRTLWGSATEATGGDGLEAMQHFARTILEHYGQAPAAMDAEAWAELHTLRAERGPADGSYATWKDAAVAERIRRVRAEQAPAASAEPVSAVCIGQSGERVVIYFRTEDDATRAYRSLGDMIATAVAAQAPQHLAGIGRLLDAAHAAVELMDGVPDDDAMRLASVELSNAAAAIGAAQAPQAQPCGSFECKAAQADGVLCADDECDRESGVRPTAQAPAVPEGWRTMESAPQDGSEVLLQVERRAGATGSCVVGHYMPGGHCIEDHPPIERGWYFWNGRMFDTAAKPIAWMPIPEITPPASAAPADPLPWFGWHEQAIRCVHHKRGEAALTLLTQMLAAAQGAAPAVAGDALDAKRYRALVNSGAYSPGRFPSCPWGLRTGGNALTKAELDAAADAAAAMQAHTEQAGSNGSAA